MSVVPGNLIHGCAASIEVGGADVGSSTENGVTIKGAPDWYKQMVDQSKVAVKLTLMGREYTVDTELSDCKMANLLMALNLASTRSCSSGSCLLLDDSAGSGGALKVVGPGVNSLSRTFLFENAMVMNDFSYAMKKTAPSVVPLTFSCLWNTVTNRAGSIGDA